MKLDSFCLLSGDGLVVGIVTVFGFPGVAQGTKEDGKLAIFDNPLTVAAIGIVSAWIGAVINGSLATRAKVNEELREARLKVYPPLWELTSQFSRWPRTPTTYGDLVTAHRDLRNWYYTAGGLYLSENARDRYGEVQELVAAHLRKRSPERNDKKLPDPVYDDLMKTCSSLRTALTEDLESRRQRSIWWVASKALLHRKQHRQAARRISSGKLGTADAARTQPRPSDSTRTPGP
jgi:hypothetical protein